jgi:hypothetical protein
VSRITTEVALVEDTFPDRFQRALVEKLNEKPPDKATTEWVVEGFAADKTGYSALLLRWRDE